MQEFNDKWKKIFYEFETKANQAIEKLIEKNLEEMRSLSSTIDKEAKNIKFSSYYEKIVDMENKLVEKEKFLDAQKIRDRVLKVKENEIEKYIKDQLVKYNSQVTKLNKIHDKEIKNLKKRIEEDRLDQERERVKELAEIDFAFKSTKIEVEVKQRSDKKEFEKKIAQETEKAKENLTLSGNLNTSNLKPKLDDSQVYSELEKINTANQNFNNSTQANKNIVSNKKK